MSPEPISVLDRGTTAPPSRHARRTGTAHAGPVRLRRSGAPLPAPAPRRRSRLRSVLADVVWLGAIVLLLLAMWPASLGGWTSYVIVHGQSMNPTYASGDLVVVRQESHYAIGDVIAYRIPRPSPIAGHMVIHRVKEITPKGILTQGDNRETEDEWYLRHDDIVGKARLHLALPGGEAFWGYVPWAFCLLIGIGVVWMMWPGRPSAAEAEEDRAVRAEEARTAKHAHSRRERRAMRSARAEIAQMVTGAVALVGAAVILILTLH